MAPPRPPRDHTACHNLRHNQRAAHINGHHLVKGCNAHIQKGFENRDAGVIHQQFKRSGMVQRCMRGRNICEIDCDRLATNFFTQRDQVRFSATERNHLRVAGGKMQGDLAADAFARTGYERAFVAEIRIHCTISAATS